ncbi:formin-like protein 2 protein [Lasius niger]|uniref:Formin-like protein 2 protein n=1 Tax=Lasius niger TaxID=67767 RepID=A0A0J7KNE6_LASNI|nr:formin-like protein 2 protein [Lasius niger]
MYFCSGISLVQELERLRPPTYNAEDYAIALRRWGRRPLGIVQDSQGTLPSTTSSSSGYASGSGEMTLRQFTSVSELLNKLRTDLRLAFPSIRNALSRHNFEKFEVKVIKKNYFNYPGRKWAVDVTSLS